MGKLVDLLEQLNYIIFNKFTAGVHKELYLCNTYWRMRRFWEYINIGVWFSKSLCGIYFLLIFDFTHQATKQFFKFPQLE